MPILQLPEKCSRGLGGIQLLECGAKVDFLMVAVPPHAVASATLCSLLKLPSTPKVPCFVGIAIGSQLAAFVSNGWTLG